MLLSVICTMTLITQVIVALYLLFFLASVFIPSWKSNNTSEYISAGRKLTLFPFIATLVTTMYGWINGIGELYAEYGISAWLFLSLPYSLFAVVFAFRYAGKAKEHTFQTLPDLLHFHYGHHVAALGALLIVLFTSPAMYLLMSMQILHFIWPVDKVWLLALVTLISAVYIIRGGMKAVVKADVIQFVLMFGGFAAVLLVLFLNYGTAPLESLPAQKTSITYTTNVWYIGSWFLFAAVVLVDPNYYQRVYAAKDTDTARNGLLLSVLCWTIFDFLAAATALYAIAVLPADTPPQSIYMALAQVALHPVIAGVFFMAMLATVLSTANGFLFTSAISLSKDLLHRYGWFTHLRVEQLNARVLAGIALLNFLLCVLYRHDTAVDLFFDTAPYAVSCLLFPVLFAYTRYRLMPNAALVQCGLSLLGTLFAHVYIIQEHGAQFNYLMVYIGLTISLLCHILFYRLGKRA